MKRTYLSSVLVFSMICFLSVGCSDSPADPVADSGPVQLDTGNQPKPEKGVTPPKTCECDDDQVCTTDFECVAKPEPAENEAVGTAVIEHFEDDTLTITSANGVAGRLAALSTLFFDKADPPWADPRTSFTTPEGYLCYHDNYSCGYPYCSNEYDVWLPVGLNAGDLTFTIEGAPGPVVYAPYNTDKQGVGDWGYALKDDEPGPIKEGNSTYSGYFDVSYVPLNASMTLAMSGGDHFDAAAYDNLAMPERLVLTAPPPDVEVPADQDLTISWDKAQAGTNISVELVSGNPMFGAALKINCTFRDSGSITIPKAELAKMHQGEVWMIIQRNATRYVKTQTKDGRPAHLMFTGRYETRRYFYGF